MNSQSRNQARPFAASDRAREQSRRRQRTYYWKNADKVRAAATAYHRKNRAEIIAKATQRRKGEGGDAVRLRDRAYHQKNRDRISARKRLWSWKRRGKPAASLVPLAPAELEACRGDPRKAKTIRGDDWIICLECGEIFQTLSRHLGPTHDLTASKYRERWGYNRRTGLDSKEFRASKSHSARRRGTVEHLKKNRPLLMRGNKVAARVPRLESRLNHGDQWRGKARPGQWKKTLGGKVASDFAIAKLRLAGFEMGQLARRVGLKSGVPVLWRLRRMGFPSGHPCLFERGEPVSGRALLNLFGDFGKTRKEVAGLLGTDVNLIYYHLSPSRLDKPLSVNLAQKVLTLKRALVGQYRSQAASKKGGRPRMLLPSERADLRRKYADLRRELKLLRGWLQGETGRQSMARVWQWLCEQSRLGVIRTLLFWPQFFRWMESRYSMKGFLKVAAWVPNEVAIEFLADEIGASFDTIRIAARTT